MKAAKKWMAALLTVLLCISLISPALADGPQYASTRNFADLLEKENLSFTYTGIVSSGDEHIFLENEDENFAYTINVYFHPDNDRVAVYVWYLIDFEDENFGGVLRTVNQLNYSYKYTRFYADETDNTVTCAMTIILQDEDSAGDIVLEALMRMASILKMAYPELAVYDK